jgi:hypothetical protein
VSWPDVPRSRGPRAPCSPQQACGFRGVGRSTERSPSSSGCSRGSLTAWPTHCCISITLAEERAKPRTTASPSAWEEYTAAFVLLDRPDRPGNTERAIALLEAALRGDPRFARAHAALGRACWVRYRETRDAAWTDRARDAVQEAIRLAPEEASSRLALAMIYDGRGKRKEALEEARRALALRPESDEGPAAARLPPRRRRAAGGGPRRRPARARAEARLRREPRCPRLGPLPDRKVRRGLPGLPPRDRAAARQCLGVPDAGHLTPAPGRPRRGDRGLPRGHPPREARRAGGGPPRRRPGARGRPRPSRHPLRRGHDPRPPRRRPTGARPPRRGARARGEPRPRGAGRRAGPAPRPTRVPPAHRRKPGCPRRR